MPEPQNGQPGEQKNNELPAENIEADEAEKDKEAKNANIQANPPVNATAPSKSPETKKKPDPHLVFLYNALNTWVEDSREFAPKGAAVLAGKLKDMDSEDPQKVGEAKKFLGNNLEKWLSHKNAHGRTNYDRFCDRAQRGRINEAISYLNNAIGMSISPEEITARKPLPREERNAVRSFYYSVKNLEAGLTDKGLFGSGGSSGEHEAMINAYNDMKYITSSYANADENLKQRNEVRRKAIEKAKKAAQDYINEKRKKGRAKEDDEKWRPSTPMGKKRFESAMKLIEELDKELKRMNAPAAESETAPEKSAEPEALQDTAKPDGMTSEQETKEKEQSSEGETQPEDDIDYDEQLRNMYGDDYLDPAKYTNLMKNANFESYGTEIASLTAKNLTAAAITAQIALKNGKQPTRKDFHNSVVDVVESPAFKTIIEDNGSPNLNNISLGTIQRLTDKLSKDNGKGMMGEYIKNTLYQKNAEKQNQKIKEDAIKTRNRSNALTKEEKTTTRSRSNAVHQKKM